jgi:hypothetical protein
VTIGVGVGVGSGSRAAAGSGVGVAAADELLAAARALLVDAGPDGGGWRARAIATLARQALEAGLDAFWRSVAPGVEEANRTEQLLCLPVYAGDDVGGQAFASWAVLSEACHVRAYDLVPTDDELARWVDDVDRLLAALAAAA